MTAPISTERQELLALFEARLQKILPFMRTWWVPNQPVRVYRSRWLATWLGPLAPYHKEVSWFSIPGLEHFRLRCGVSSAGRVITWHTTSDRNGFYAYTTAAGRLSDRALADAYAAMESMLIAADRQ